MKVNDAITGMIVLVLAIFAFLHAGTFQTMPGVPYGPNLFPRIVSGIMGLGGVLLIFSGLRQAGPRRWLELEAWAMAPRSYVIFFSIVGVVIAYILFADVLGFLLIAFILLTFLLTVTRGTRSLPSNVVISVVFAVTIFVAFGWVLRVPLPHGYLEAVLMGYA